MKRALFFILMGLFLACQPAASEHAHDHGSEEVGHSHSSEVHSVTQTVWTDKLELFVEFSPLVVGTATGFTVHLTDLTSFEAVSKGKVIVSLVQGKKGIRQTVETPVSPGIFKTSLLPKKPGKCELIFDVETPDFKDRIVLNGFEVFPSQEKAEAAHPHPADDPNHIGFPKEQAWKIDFANAAVRKDSFFQIIRTGGELMATRGNEKTVAATASGILVYKKSNSNIGSAVRRGESLFAVAGGGIIDRDLESRFLKAKSTYEQAQVRLDRKTKLYENKAISKPDFEEASLAFQLAKTEYQTVAASYSKGGKTVSAPQAGFIKQLFKSEGDFVEAGEALAVIAENKTVTLRADVPASYYGQLSNIHSANFTAHGKTYALQDLNGKLLSYGRSVSSDQPKVPVYFELDNAVDLLPGSFVEAFLQMRPQANALLIPSSALLEEYGSYSVLVQNGGEDFELRPIKIGSEDGTLVEVVSGLEADERVVTQGAYQIKMAALSGTVPAHGHAH